MTRLVLAAALCIAGMAGAQVGEGDLAEPPPDAVVLFDTTDVSG